MSPRSCSLSLLLILSVLVIVPGCAKKPKISRTISNPKSSSLAGMNGSGSGLDGAGGIASGPAPSTWGPGTGAPDGNGFGSTGSMGMTDDGFGSSAPGADSFDSATNDLLNNTNTAGVEAGTFSAELEMIHFEFDSDMITEAWQAVLDGHCSWLNENPSVMVQVEGHCDDRGTEEYNVSLGQRRADAVRSYMAGKGVDPNRLSTISYGEMRPMDIGGTEEAHALNRRAMFLVYEVDNALAASF